MVADEEEPLTLLLEEDYQESVSFHPWFAMRRRRVALAAVALTISPEWLRDPEKLAMVAAGNDHAIAAAIAQDRPQGSDSIDARQASGTERFLDLCAGTGTVGAMAARLGFDALTVELFVIPHLIDRVLHEFAVTLASPSTAPANLAGGKLLNAWRGFAAEVEDFADTVWRGARSRLMQLFEEDIDIRLWVRIVGCPACGESIPLVTSPRLSADTALNVSSVPSSAHIDSGLPRFGLLRTNSSDLKGTMSRGKCSCPACGHQFLFRGADLVPLSAVPIAVRMRGSSVLEEIEAPGGYVKEVSSAAEDSLAASEQALGNRSILADEQPLFHDVRGEPINTRRALLPRQRAYFAALAESMDKASAALAERTALTEEQQLAVRSAVGLLISGQVGYVNTFTQLLADKPRQPIFAGQLRLTGLFAEVGGAWLERYWKTRLRRLLGMLQQKALADRPVRAIQADAAAVPLKDAVVSAVVWDPPYYDNVDYDTAGEPYQAVLAAMLPDVASELVVPSRLARRERTERYESDLLRQAGEARRVLGPNGRVGVFWLAEEPTELQRFLEMIAPTGLRLVRAVQLDTVRTPRIVAVKGPNAYLLVLQPMATAAFPVAVDAEKVLALATEGALSLYDGLAELLESAWDPSELSALIPQEFEGSQRQRLVGFVAGHPELEQLLIEFGRISLRRELTNRGFDSSELQSIDTRGLARLLLGQLGFAVALPMRFSIREALRECEVIESRLELADSVEIIRGAFLAGCKEIERILRYAILSWIYLAFGSRSDTALQEIITSMTETKSYSGPNMLSFGRYELLFSTLPRDLGSNNDVFEQVRFAQIARILKRTKFHEKLSVLIALRNSVEHDKEEAASLPPGQLRARCCAALRGARKVLTSIDDQGALPVTVRPEEERRDRYGRRVLRVLDPDGVAIEVHVGSETDLTEPLIYFASESSRRDVDPKFLRAATIEKHLGLT